MDEVPIITLKSQNPTCIITPPTLCLLGLPSILWTRNGRTQVMQRQETAIPTVISALADLEMQSNSEHASGSSVIGRYPLWIFYLGLHVDPESGLPLVGIVPWFVKHLRAAGTRSLSACLLLSSSVN